MGRFRFDLVAVAASLLALVMLFVYLSVINQQEGDVALWAVAVLVVGAGAAAYGAATGSPHRRASLIAAGLLLGALGVLAILSIGLPILVAGVLALVAAMRAGPTPAPSA